MNAAADGIRTVLLLEDCDSDRQLLDFACTHAGLQVHWQTATSCAELSIVLDGIGAGELPRPALAIFDQRLPDGLGTDQIPRLRATLPDTPLVFFSTSCEPDDRARIPADVQADYLVKPYTLADYQPIIDRVRSALQPT